MTLSKGAAGNLINRYRAVLRKCRMMNVFGSLVVAGLLVAGSAGNAGAEGEELQGTIEPISVQGETKSFHGGQDVTLTSGTPSQPYAIHVLAGGNVSIVMDTGKTLTVKNAYLGNSGSSQIIYGGTAALRAAGTGSTGVFSGIGNFKATGGGKNFETSAILSEDGADLTLSGDITGEAVADPKGSEGDRSYGAAAVDGGKLTFQGERAFLKASSLSGKNAAGALAKAGGVLRFESKSVMLESINVGAGSVGIDSDGGTFETGENTALSIRVEGNLGATGIQNRSSSTLHIGGTLDIAAKQSGDTFSSAYGIDSDSGKVIADGPVSIKAEAPTGTARGISVSGATQIALQDDVDIDVQGNSYGVHTTYDMQGQKAALPTVVLGSAQRTVAIKSALYGVDHEGGTLTFAGKAAISGGFTGVFVKGGNSADAFASLRFEGPVTIDAPTAVSLSSGSAANTDGTVTFAYNPTPINVPVAREQADSRINGSISGFSGIINKEGAGSLALNGDNSSFRGTFNQKAGWTFLGEAPSGYFCKGKVVVSGGTLVAPALSFDSQGKLTLNGGTLVTGTGQLFTNALLPTGENTDPGSVKLDPSNWDFQSGMITFDDAKYNLDYAQKAAETLGATSGENASAEKEITFTGALVALPIDSTERLRRALKDTTIGAITLDGDIKLTSRLQENTPVTRSLSIDGGGHTLSGEHPAFWFADMQAGAVSIQNITFDGLKSDKTDRYDQPIPFGPSIYFNMDDWKSEAKLIIGDGVAFKNNLAVYDSAGGAVRTAQGIVDIGDNVSFLNNKGGAGGGLYSESFTTIGDNVTFEGNEARRGGALDVIDDYDGYPDDPDYKAGTRKVKYVHIGKNALFKDNRAIFDFGGNGGAIEVQSGELVIGDGAVFSGNTSNDTAGAIAICDWSRQLPGKVTLGDVSFVKNSADSHGGAVFNEGELLLNGVAAFEENTSAEGMGGALCNTGSLVFASDGNTLSRNTAAGGGAIYNEGSVDLRGSADFIGNSATESGGAIFNSGAAVFASKTIFSGNAAAKGGAIYNTGSVDLRGSALFTQNNAELGGVVCNTDTVTAQDEVVFSQNTASYGAVFFNQGEASLNGKATFLSNTASADGGAVYNMDRLILSDGAVFSGNSAAGDGGALYNDAAAEKGEIVSTGDIRFNGGALVTDNHAGGTGGAIYNNYAVTLNPGEGREIRFSGNTDSTGANAVYMAAGSRLDVAGAGRVVFDDPLSFEDATPVLTKSGDGDLLLNASMNGFLGTLTLDGGTTKIAEDWTLQNVVTLTAGSLELPSFSFAAPDENAHVAGGKLILGGGTLVTNTGQIFNAALNAEGSNSETGGVKSSVEKNLTFDSGLIAFNDVAYNLQYAGSAATALGADYAPEAGTGGKEITFTGDLYTAPDPDPDPPVIDPDPDPQPPVIDPDPEPDPEPPVIDPDPEPDPEPPVIDPDPDPEPPVIDPDPDPVPPTPEPDPTPGPSGSVSIKDLNENNISNVVLGNTTITTGTEAEGGKNLIVGGSRVDDGLFKNAEALPGSIGSRNVDLGAEGSGVMIVGGHYLTLVGGAPDTSLIEAGEDKAKPVDVRIGGSVDGETSTGTLNLGTPAMTSGGILKGNVRIAEGSALNVRAGEHTVTGEAEGTQPAAGIDNRGGAVNVGETATLRSSLRQESGETHVAGTLESSSVELTGGRLDVSGRARVDRLVQHDGETEVSGAVESSSLVAENGVIRVIGTMKTDELASASGVRIAVGDGNAAGRLYVTSATLGGGEAFLDPAWNGNDTLETASHGVLNFRDGIVDGRLGVGRNALLVLGDATADWTLAAFDASGLRWGQNDVSAALSLRSPQRLSPTQGAIMVDGSLTEAPALTPNTATFADRSLLVVDASGLNGGAALASEGGTLAVAETAALLVANPTEGDYVITAGFADNAGVKGWDGAYLSTPDRLMALALDKDEAGTVKVRARARDAASVLPGVSLPNILNEIWKSGRNDVDSPDMGARFLSRAVNEDFLRPQDAVPVIDGAAQIAVAGGVQGVALAASAAPARAVQDHASLAGTVAGKGGEVRGEGLDLWIKALYDAERARDFGAGSLDVGYNADFGGVVFGGDMPVGPVRLGVALNAGGGTARSRGDFPSTKNDFDFWGVTLYGSWTRGGLNVVADAGYSEERNEVRQTLPASLRLGQLKADVDAHVLTFGLRGEYLFRTDWADVMPHAGLRYTEAVTESFSSRIEGRDVFHVDEDTQRIWSFPVGVTVGKELHTDSGWRVKPRVDLSVVPAAGDAKAHTRVRTPGVAASDGVSARVMDELSFDGSVGLELEKDNVSFGLNCGVQASEHQRGQSVGVTFTYKF